MYNYPLVTFQCISIYLSIYLSIGLWTNTNWLRFYHDKLKVNWILNGFKQQLLKSIFSVYFSIWFFRNKSDDYLYLYIRNLENSHLKRVFGIQYPFIFVFASRENTKWILCCWKMVLNVQYLRFLKMLNKIMIIIIYGNIF